MLNRRHGLSKYDAPLRIQFQKGYDSFKRGKVKNPFHPNSMQYREWCRGFNSAYFQNLKKVKNYEFRNRSKKVS
tara:strand:- start:405 stop:626 length:222 start_codon:yes stop_codon:yes gene_type:complete